MGSRFRNSLGMKLENGIPSHDTIQRVWWMINPEEFEKCFCAWVEAVCQKTEGEIASIDGKALRRSGGGEQKPTHMVSAWASEQQMAPGQLAAEEKSNEITAVPQLLDMLDVSGCIVTADAMSCQKALGDREFPALVSGYDVSRRLQQDSQRSFRRKYGCCSSYCC